jgi:hypothetical protein
MTAYSSAFTSAATPAAGAPYATLNSPTRRARLVGLDVSLLTATASQVGLGVPANESTPPVGTTAGIPTGSAADIAATARYNIAWSTAPTAPTNFEKNIMLSAVIGAGWSWLWPPGKEPEIKIAGWRVLWNPNASAAGTLLVSLLHDE